jgi:predicted RNA-binding protein (virulence factor B family)
VSELSLGDEQGNDVLLPTKWIPEGAGIGDKLTVFVYTDSEDRPIATTLTPKATVQQFGFMRVNQVNEVGAFLDWAYRRISWCLIASSVSRWRRVGAMWCFSISISAQVA